MGLLNLGLVLGSGIALVGGLDCLKRKLLIVFKRWDKLGLNKYRIKRYYKEGNSLVMIIEVAIGGSLSDLKSYSGKIEKAYGCKCEIEDVECSKYITVILNYDNLSEIQESQAF
ncbi:hypothetical protein H8S20_04760 [Clostridium sp. NSJ-6]|uniref:Uncharacterized protein n=1 Tax=Clostridium hominis TaxID=2763036 RepID=A0ABR7D9X8_9CLOT|nr:hypothetical protein [Clostridium hominis]MBC5628202.1 hypothetical protein [Clostridium hominis]MDU2671376.1 hypothetical protein [Clostridium sp.]